MNILIETDTTVGITDKVRVSSNRGNFISCKGANLKKFIWTFINLGAKNYISGLNIERFEKFEIY